MFTADSKPGFNKWDVPAAPAGICRQASNGVWLIGAVETAVFGFCVAVMAVLASLPPEQFEEFADQASIEHLTLHQPVFVEVAVTLFVLGVLPGVAYLLLGYPVRQENSLGITAALVLAMTQCMVFGLLLLRNLVATLIEHDPAATTLQILTLGSLLLLLGCGAYRLWQARRHVNR